jgi:hypothetical protein
MEGSLFVAAKAAGESADAPGLVLNSANGKVDLSQASASLSKGSGNSVDVQVLEGKASIKGKDGQSKELSSGSFGALGARGLEFDKNNLRVLSPLPQKPVAMDAEDLHPIPFKWTGFPAETQVSLWVGRTRREMREFSKAAVGESEINVKMPFGRHYWKLVAKTPDGKVFGESPVYKTEVVARYAPTVVFPTADAEVPANTSPFDMAFKWQKGDDTRQVSLEVWSDETLSKKVVSKSFANEDSYTLPGLKEGTYYWRMTSYFTDSDKPILGKLQKFTVKPAEKVAVEPVKKPELIPVNVAFTMPETQLTQYYVESPRVGLTWSADKMDHVVKYRVRVHTEEEDPSLVPVVDVKETKFTTNVTKPGRYIASIEAVDKDGQVVGTTTSQPVTVAPLPTLKAPNFIPAEGALQASVDGKSQLEWSKIDGATEYWLVIKKDGKELKRSKYSSTSTALRNLLPGEYEVGIAAQDSYGRVGESSPIRKLLVPDKSGVRAPTLKKIKVN